MSTLRVKSRGLRSPFLKGRRADRETANAKDGLEATDASNWPDTRGRCSSAVRVEVFEVASQKVVFDKQRSEIIDQMLNYSVMMDRFAELAAGPAAAELTER